MKHTLFILALITASIQTFAQSPRIKLNQITKDSVTGSVLISSPTDSGMVYSRELYISYGADTVLILNGDTLAATSGIISSVLSDGVTVLGNGTTGDELRLDTFVIATVKGLNDTLTARGYLTANQTITLSGDVTGSGTTAITATVVDDSHNHIISNVDNLQTELDSKLESSDLTNYVTTNTTQTISGAKTFTAALTQSGGDANFDSGTLFVDESENRVGIGTTSPSVDLDVLSNAQFNKSSTDGGYVNILGNNSYINIGADKGGGAVLKYNANGNLDITPRSTFNTVFTAGNVGIGTTSPSVQLELSTDGAKKLTTTTWATGSDRRIKKNIINYNKGLNEIIQLNPIEYELNGKANTINGAKGIGLIAQEVQPIIPEAVTGYYGKLNQDDESDTYLYNINTHSFFFMFINAFKEQQSIIESQASEIEQLKTLITDLSNRLQILENN